MRSTILFENEEHKWIFIGRDPEKNEEVIDTNEYLILNNNQGVMLDPGGTVIFPQVLTEITRHILTDNIKSIVSSHQDPDIASSIAMWLDLCPSVKVYCSWLWTGFISHFGMGSSLKLDIIPDEGMELTIGDTNAKVYLIPAHFCHSPGNFSCYDPISNILFSGDIGAAIIPEYSSEVFVQDFSSHIKYMEKFHQRWMPSDKFLKAWVRRVRAINPSMIAPQHGYIFKDDNVGKFLDWLENLDVGIWNDEQEKEDIENCIWMKWKK